MSVSSGAAAVVPHTHPPRVTQRRVPVITDADAQAGLLARLSTVVAAQPDAVALVDDDRSMTFAEVAELAARTARAVDRLSLRRWHPDADDEDLDPVAVLGAHRAETVAAVIGIIAAGAPVVVLDHALPHPRLLQYLQRSGARAVVCDVDHRERALLLAAAIPSADSGVTVVPIPLRPDDSDTAADDARARSGDLLPPGRLAPDVRAPAALVFTSGTTGRPKGVVYDHRLFPSSAYNVSVRDGTYDADDVLASVLPLGFSAGLDHTLASLQVGARQQLRDLRAAGTGNVIAWLRSSGVTVLNTTPSMARALVAQVPEGARLADLRSLTLTSEALHHSDVEALRRVLPADCALSNRWGASETGLATVFPLEPGLADRPGHRGSLPVGWPVPSVQLEIEPTPGAAPGSEDTGVVTVTSAFIARRYWRDPEKTAEVFTELPDGRRRFRTADVGRLDDTGCFMLVGRRDHSVKIRGYLVEPGEIDAALFALPDIQESVVVGDDSGPRTRLVAYVVSTALPAAAVVRSRLREVLPPWMVPETIVFLERLPRTERGKIDRAALPPAPPLVAGGTPPRNDWEGTVADLWARVLHLPEVGVHDDFFELGGDSLTAEELLAIVDSELGFPGVDSHALLGAATVAEFAAALRLPVDRQHPTLVPLRVEGSRRPLFCVAGGGGLALAFVPLVRHLDPELPVWGLQAHSLEHRGRPDWSVRSAARRHVRELRSVQPHGPYRLLGYSFGGVLALEVARQLTAAGEVVESLVVLDAFPPGSRGGIDPDRSRLNRARDVLGMLVAGIGPDLGQGQYPRFHRQAQFLTGRYHPRHPWPGRALVVAAEGSDRIRRVAWQQALAGPWSVVDVAGDHYSMLREPHVGRLAAMVEEFLAP